MHYILNTSINIPITKKGFTGEFKPGNLYTLYHIKNVEDGVLYIFKSHDGKEIKKQFSSCKEADIFISKLKNEKLPDYETIYDHLRSS